jgi:gentisate 1,2-dioxygenase
MSTQTSAEPLAAFVEQARALRLDPVFLTQPGFMLPVSQIQPYRWRWRDALPLMMRAGELLPVGAPGAERRVLNLINPAITSGLGTSHTLTASIQMVLPGEAAPAHRHTPAALRFIIQGKGARTTVDGLEVTMNAGDLVLTPSWCWHDHSNPADDTMIWLDGLDLPLVKLLQALLFEEYPEKMQPIQGAAPSFLIYPWASTVQKLAALTAAEPDPFDDHVLAYANPAAGGPTLPTIACEATLLRPGTHTRAHRHTASVVYHVVEGRGATIVDGERLEWAPHDTFVLPSWAWHEHQNASPRERAVLFSFNDAPSFRALGLYREEPHPADRQ